MRRYGGDLKRAKLTVLFFAFVVFLITIPVFWLGFENTPTRSSAMPPLWVYGLIICPIVLIVIVSFALKKFERINR